VSKKIKNKIKRHLKVLKRNSKKCTEIGVNENKQTEYTKELIKEKSLLENV